MDKRTFFVGLASFSVMGLATLLFFLFARPEGFRGTMYGDPLPPAPGITLTKADGGTFRLDDYRGKIILLFFGYAYCPDICPATLAEMRLALSQLREAEARQVQVVFISVDPQRDAPEAMQEYVKRFHPDFIGLSGTDGELQPIWSGYGVFREVVEGSSPSNYIINHTARVTLIDQDGNLRLTYGFQTPPADIAHDIRILLKR